MRKIVLFILSVPVFVVGVGLTLWFAPLVVIGLGLMALSIRIAAEPPIAEPPIADAASRGEPERAGTAGTA